MEEEKSREFKIPPSWFLVILEGVSGRFQGGLKEGLRGAKGERKGGA